MFKRTESVVEHCFNYVKFCYISFVTEYYINYVRWVHFIKQHLFNYVKMCYTFYAAFINHVEVVALPV